MNAHQKLERQLRDSVAAAAGRRPAGRSRVWRWSGVVSPLVFAASVTVAIVVAVVALTGLRHGSSPGPNTVSVARPSQGSRLGPRPRDPGPVPGNVDDALIAASWNRATREDHACAGGPTRNSPSVSYGAPSAQMLATIPALQSPHTSADRLPAPLSGNERPSPITQSGTVYVRYVRRALVTHGFTFYLVPVANIGRKPLPAAIANRCYRLEVAALAAQLPRVPPAKRAATRRYGIAEFTAARYNLETSTIHEGVILLQTDAGNSAAYVAETPSTIRRMGTLGGTGFARPDAPFVMAGIVPAGVASVSLRYPGSVRHGKRLPKLTATGDVVNNVFVIPIPTRYENASPASAIWRSQSGEVLKTINARPLLSCLASGLTTPASC